MPCNTKEFPHRTEVMHPIQDFNINERVISLYVVDGPNAIGMKHYDIVFRFALKPYFGGLFFFSVLFGMPSLVYLLIAGAVGYGIGSWDGNRTADQAIEIAGRSILLVEEYRRIVEELEKELDEE